ncbi:MAG: hypothetical protein E3J37_03385 [Anaerolineales bacterium]|nr:MAG: hypothetical protein E3J37_03385 [Anaerolineales bacterium]
MTFSDTLTIGLWLAWWLYSLMVASISVGWVKRLWWYLDELDEEVEKRKAHQARKRYDEWLERLAVLP